MKSLNRIGNISSLEIVEYEDGSCSIKNIYGRCIGMFDNTIQAENYIRKLKDARVRENAQVFNSMRINE